MPDLMRRPTTASTSPATLCVVLPTWVGDACMATPTLRALRRTFPESKIVGIMRPVIHDVLEKAWGNDQPWIDESLLFNKKSGDRAGSRWGLVRQIRKSGAKLAILLTNSLWSAAAVRLGGVSRVVGYHRDARGVFLSDRVPVPHDGQHLCPISPIDYYLYLAHWVGCDTQSEGPAGRAMQIGVTPADEFMAERVWRQAGFSQQRPIVTINSGSATQAARLWPVEQVQELARRLVCEFDTQVLLHCGPAEREGCNAIADRIANPCVVSMGIAEQLPIGLSKAVLKRSDVVVSTDSGPRHLAVALNRPVVTLFGPTSPEWTQTYNHPESILSAQLDCNACSPGLDPVKFQHGMRHISVDRVLTAVANIIPPTKQVARSIPA